ncbi:hypothetical protein NEOLEDRAFT_86906 [Neolentinus lepideus HHB14362 ss-1]|uniref:Uncharacterized protein n=1 Tax=Neolentinus lepideus HHB14362 ss-1 TaxID=1314782 RepID=A0A165MXT8_9AGAM|nr:hypothetical protein NEOLEDRAFT_86906 [Neolentinus lepideus HHB14362 ss-1]
MPKSWPKSFMLLLPKTKHLLGAISSLTLLSLSSAHSNQTTHLVYTMLSVSVEETATCVYVPGEFTYMLAKQMCTGLSSPATQTRAPHEITFKEVWEVSSGPTRLAAQLSTPRDPASIRLRYFVSCVRWVTPFLQRSKDGENKGNQRNRQSRSREGKQLA